MCPKEITSMEMNCVKTHKTNFEQSKSKVMNTHELRNANKAHKTSNTSPIYTSTNSPVVLIVRFRVTSPERAETVQRAEAASLAG